MVRGRAQGRDQPVKNPNPKFMTLLMNIQRRLDEPATMMQQQAVMIQNLQQRQVGVMDLKHEIPEDEDVNMGPSNGGNEHGGNGVEDPPLGAPR